MKADLLSMYAFSCYALYPCAYCIATDMIGDKAKRIEAAVDRK